MRKRNRNRVAPRHWTRDDATVIPQLPAEDRMAVRMGFVTKEVALRRLEDVTRKGTS